MSNIITTTGRQAFEWFELDIPKCSNTYGVAPCNATLGVTGSEKCFNGRATCQDPDNYDQSSTLTLSFCHNQGYIPDDRYYLPYLQSASITPASLNIGGGNKNKSALGTRGSLSVSLSDHPHTDRLVDPYLESRTYDPLERSTFWAKWRARNPFYMHRPCRINRGYIDPETGLVDPETLITSTFFITGFSGFSAGDSISIQASDVLTFAGNEKAKAPFVSTGKLSTDITNIATTLTLTPSGVGDLEYPASGKLSIGKEVVAFTRALDVFTIIRASSGTSASDHKAGDTVQLCLEFDSKSPSEILTTLLSTYAKIELEYLDTAQWASEVTDYLPRLYSTIITQPTGVTELVSEICEQMYFTTVWDERTAKLKIRAVRPPDGEVIRDMTDEANLLEDSTNWSDAADQLITDVWVYYAQRDPTIKLDEKSNYAIVDVISDTESKGVTQNNVEQIRTIYSRWITEGGAALDLGYATLARFNQIPRECSFSVDAKDRDLWLADFITVTNRHVVDQYGIPKTVAMQITSAQEASLGTTFSYTAIEYNVDNAVQDGEINFVIGSDIVNLNLRDYYNEYIGVEPVSGDKIRFKVRSNAAVGGCAFTDANNITTVASTSTDSITTISKLAALSFFDGHYHRTLAGVRLVRDYVFSKVQRKGIVTPASFEIGDTYDNPRVDIYNKTLSNTVKEYPLSHSLDTGLWPEGVELFLDIEAGGIIVGEAPTSPVGYYDNGGDGIFYFSNVFGGDGGNAILAQHPITIDNNGTIAGAGGAGASGGRTFRYFMSGLWAWVTSGGGGRGYDYGQKSIDFIPIGDAETPPIRMPSQGNLLGSGVGGIIKPPSLIPFSAGNGGDYGVDGTDAGAELGRYGLAGAATVTTGDGLITWVNKGTVLGAEV